MGSLVVTVSMPKLETGMRTNKSGFTLIEILVVLVILGITASMAIMAFGDFGKSRGIEAEAERFAHKLRLVRYHAILEAVPYRVQVSPTAYQIFRFVPPNQWEKSNIKSAALHVQGAKQQYITIQASGEVTAFKLIFGLPQHPPIAEVHGLADGHIIKSTATS
jgi:general secretion pathway protein H